MNAKCGLVTCPPGVESGHTGGLLGGLKLVFKYIGAQNAPLGSLLD